MQSPPAAAVLAAVGDLLRRGGVVAGVGGCSCVVVSWMSVMSCGRWLGAGCCCGCGSGGSGRGIGAGFMRGGGSVVDEWVRAALGLAEGYILDWRRTGGCQLISAKFSRLLSCPYRETKWRCEAIGPHTVHRWSDHLICHERMGNGYHCLGVESWRLNV